nr:uncharacterized protein LOC109407399 [Aedes albopictus]XP_029708674.1 uncharacterized protein LOC109407399 [Aedes albopictus]
MMECDHETSGLSFEIEKSLDEDSFDILEPSLDLLEEDHTADDGQRRESVAITPIQTTSNGSSVIHEHESEESSVYITETITMEVISDNESRLPEIDEETSLSLQSTTSEDYIQMVQSLIKEHKEIRQRLQKANEILQNDFAIIRKRLQEVNEKYADQCAANELLEKRMRH